MPPSPPSVRLILHGSAADRDDVREAVDRIRERGAAVDVRVTWESGHAELFASEAAGVRDVVIAGGGDGTLGGVATGLLAGEGPGGTALGVLPLGTANDFATWAGIPTDDVDAALEVVFSGSRTPVDLARCDERAFVNMATGGFGAEVTQETPEGLKKILGGLSYLVSGITHLNDLKPHRGRLHGPGFEWEGSFLAVAVGNGKQAGGGIELCPRARLDDGLVDVLVVPEGDGAGRLLLEALLRDRETVLDESALSVQLPWVEVETDGPIQFNLDGEPQVSDRFRFEAIPDAIPLLLPPDSPLLG